MFFSTLALGLITTQSAILSLNLKYDIYDHDDDARNTDHHLGLGRGMDRPLQDLTIGTQCL